MFDTVGTRKSLSEYFPEGIIKPTKQETDQQTSTKEGPPPTLTSLWIPSFLAALGPKWGLFPAPLRGRSAQRHGGCGGRRGAAPRRATCQQRSRRRRLRCCGAVDHKVHGGTRRSSTTVAGQKMDLKNMPCKTAKAIGGSRVLPTGAFANNVVHMYTSKV